ncbi:hypothetical protein ANN_25160 [Periplaneta americana]|uniref:C2H2-type domain-containing protein n=1 Tax=Periplaneta americana TaxID=6978 RepID=A0ABQ8S0K8_PERAM|nr:hypothetical protein ANN_25160 [Periplaneta americana]
MEDGMVDAQVFMNRELLGQQTVGEEQQLYPCPRCKKVYRWMISLRRHIRLECGQEPKHHCLYCGRKFKHKHHLIGHMAIHVRRGHQLRTLPILNIQNFDIPGSSIEERKGT